MLARNLGKFESNLCQALIEKLANIDNISKSYLTGLKSTVKDISIEFSPFGKA